MKKIVIKVEKVHEKANIVSIEGIEFNAVSEPLIGKQGKNAVRSKLKGVQR